MREALIFGAVALQPPSYYRVHTVKLSDAIFRHTIYNLRDGKRQTFYGLSDTEEIKPSSLSLHTPEEIEGFKRNPVFVEHCKFLRSEDCLFQRTFMPHTIQHHLEPTEVITSIIEVQTYSIETMQEKGLVYSKVVINDEFDIRFERVYEHNTQHLVQAHVEAVKKANECFPLLTSVAVDTGSSSSLKTRSEEYFNLVIRRIENIIPNVIPNASMRIVRRSYSGREETEETPLQRQYERLNRETGGTQTTQSLSQLLRNYPWRGTLNERRQQSILISSALEKIESDELEDLKLQLHYLLKRTKA